MIELGRTVPTFRQALEEEMEKWKEYRKALREDQRKSFDRMMEACKRHSSASGQAKRPDPLEAMIFSILLEQQMMLESLEKRIDRIQRIIEG